MTICTCLDSGDRIDGAQRKNDVQGSIPVSSVARFIIACFALAACDTSALSGLPTTTGAPAPASGEPVPGTDGKPSPWQIVGGKEVAPGAATSGPIAVSDGVVYVAYVDQLLGQKVTVAKTQDIGWSTVGPAGFTRYAALDFTLSLSVDDGTPYIAAIFLPLVTSSSAGVMKYDGTQWIDVGALDAYDNSGGQSLALAVWHGTPYVAFVDRAGTGRVLSFDGSRWTDLPGAAAMGTGIMSVMFNVVDGVPWIALTRPSQPPLQLLRHTGMQWVKVATGDIGAFYGGRLIGSAGQIFLVYQGQYASGGAVVVRKLVGATLERVGPHTSITSSRTIESLSGTAWNGVPYVAFDDEDRDLDPTPRAATVMGWDGMSWGLVAGYPSNCDIENTALEVDQASGHLYLAYTNCTGNLVVQVH